MLSPVTKAIFKRDLRRWFGNPTGYVFLTLFVILATAALFWPNGFFQRNLANLDTLNDWFPLLLLFFVPAITMSVWAGERGAGTDELLLTLPATDGHIVLGKFFAAAGIYTVALLFTVPILFFLAFLGDPDWGLMLSNYAGFWLLGVTLVAAGMVGSQLSDNLTVAFILGAIFCGLLIMLEQFFGGLFPEIARSWAGFGPISLFKEMGRGVVSLPSILLFVGLTAGFLYLNLVLLGRRHWNVGAGLGTHYGIRFASLLVAAVALTAVGANAGARADMTSESVHSLSSETESILSSLPGDRPVMVQAFVSPEVPPDYVQTRRTLLDLLRQVDAIAGDRVRVRVVDTERYSDAAAEAEKNFGIMHQTRVFEEDGRAQTDDIYLGVAFTSGLDEVVLPFLDKGLPVEYEIARSLRVVASAERRKVGVLDNDVKAFGGFDFQRMRSDPEWDILGELKLQYEVVRVNVDEEYPEGLDVLVALMPSSLTQPQMDTLARYVKSGKPTLLIDDPFPTSAPQLAPSEPKGGPQNPMMGQQPNQEQKGDIVGMLKGVGIDWASAAGFQPSPVVVWDAYNPFPQYDFDPELVFISPAANPRAFNEGQAITAGLQQVVAIFGGHVRENATGGLTWIPLLRTSNVSGSLTQNDMFRFDPFFGRAINPRRPHRNDGTEKVLACRVLGKPAGGEHPIDTIFVADLDMISRDFFEMRRRGLENLNFDNVTFLLNCVDTLAGDESFVELRKRRPMHRTLTHIEAQEATYETVWLDEKEKAEEKAQADLAEARQRLDERVAQIEQRTDLDDQSKQIQIQSVQDVEQRKLEVREGAINDQKARVIDDAQREKIRAENKIRDFYRIGSVAITPIPAVLVGLWTLLRRRNREKDTSRIQSASQGGAS